MNIQEDVVLTDEIVRNIAEFSGIMLSEELTYQDRHRAWAVQGSNQGQERIPKETGHKSPAWLSNSF